MPSFRAGVAIVESRAGVSPAAVLDAARAGISSGWHVEDSFVDATAMLRTGLPRITIRFVVASSNDRTEDDEAWQAAKAMATAVGQVAAWKDLRVYRRVKGRWVVLEAHE